MQEPATSGPKGLGRLIHCVAEGLVFILRSLVYGTVLILPQANMEPEKELFQEHSSL